MSPSTGAKDPFERKNDSLYRTSRKSSEKEQVNVQQDKAYAVGVLRKDLVIPPLCTCCMRRTSRLETVPFASGKKQKKQESSDAFRTPICDDCVAHRKELKTKRILTFVLSLLFGIITMLLIMAFVKCEDWIAVVCGAGVLILTFVSLTFGLKMKHLSISHSSRFESVQWMAAAARTAPASTSSLYQSSGHSDSSPRLLFTNPQYAQALYDANERLVSSPQEITKPNTASVRSFAKLDHRKFLGFLRAAGVYILLAALFVWLNMSFGLFRNLSFDTPAPVSSSLGAVSGIVRDAVTGDPIGEVSIDIFRQESPDDPIASVSTDLNGMYSASLPEGMFHASFTHDGYEPASLTLISTGNQEVPNQNCALSPLIEQGQIRIVLEWGATPADLDSHLVNKSNGIHVYFSKKEAIKGGEVVVNLDLDDTNSYGPETTTIMAPVDGEFIFLVHDYTNLNSTSSSALARSGAKVSVYTGSGPAQVFEVPNEPGTCWKVFSMENRVVTPIMTMSYARNLTEIER